MNIRRMFMTIAAVMLTSAVFADSASVTSKKYVDDFMTGYQNKIPGSGTNKLMIYDSNESDGINQKAIVSELGSSTSAANVPNVGAVKAGMNGKQDTINGTAGYVMTGTGYDGSVGEKPIYGTSSRYTSALVTAETVNSGVINAVNSSLIRVGTDGQPNDNGTLWEIQDDLVALNICSNYTPATGTVVQNGTPTPTNPILPTFYQQGDMILRRVGDYADSYNETTNKITRQVGVKVLDGTESWSTSGTSGGNAFRFVLTLENPVNSSDASSLCTHIKRIVLTTNTNQSNRPCLRYPSSGSSIQWYDADNTRTLADFKSFLAAQYAAGTPVVVYYPLATPFEESMPPRCQ